MDRTENDRGANFPPTADFNLDFRSDALQALHKYWTSKLAGRSMPRRADIDPTEIPKLLQHILLADVEHNPFRVRFRLVGTHIVNSVGRDATGRYFEEVYQETLRDGMIELYANVVRSKMPVRYFGETVIADKKFRDFESLHMPLSDDGRTVNIILAGLHFFLPKPTAA